MELETIMFYHGISGHHHLIHIKQADGADLIRCGKGYSENWHLELVKLFIKEIAEAAGMKPLSPESHEFFKENYVCDGGAHAYIFAKDNKNFQEGMIARCILYGRSANYGSADFSLVKRIFEQAKMFDDITVWKPKA